MAEPARNWPTPARGLIETSPQLVEARPETGRNQLSLGRSQPDFRRRRPQFSQPISNLADCDPHLGRSQPGPGRWRPSWGRNHSCGRHHPKFWPMLGQLCPKPPLEAETTPSLVDLFGDTELICLSARAPNHFESVHVGIASPPPNRPNSTDLCATRFSNVVSWKACRRNFGEHAQAHAVHARMQASPSPKQLRTGHLALGGQASFAPGFFQRRNLSISCACLVR